MLVLDTSAVDAGDRADAYQSAVSQNCTTSAASFEDPEGLWARISAYEVGDAKILTIDASGTTLRRTPRMARGMNDCPIAVALPVRSRNRLLWSREDRAFDRSDLMLVDLSAPYVYSWVGDGASYAFHVDYDRLDLPMDVIRDAMPNLLASPIYSLVRDHFAHLMTHADAVAGSGAAASVGAASIELMRALIVTAADDARAREMLHRSLPDRIDAYIAHHLKDADLTPARIAKENALSLRQLYRLYEHRGLSLEATIVEQRLRGAHAAITSGAAGAFSIGELAGAWGFRSPSHFSERFRKRYGITPRQLRAEHAGSGVGGGPAEAPLSPGVSPVSSPPLGLAASAPRGPAP